MIALVAFIVCGAALARAAGEPAPTDPQLFDLALAQRELNELNAQRIDLQTLIADTLDRVDGLTVTRDFIDMNSAARAEALDQSRAEARQMAVASYVGLSPSLSGYEMLDAQSAAELMWRNSMLRQQSERLALAAGTYATLAGEADESVLALSDEINEHTRKVEALNHELARVMAQIPKAEWHVEIAQIHDFASQEFRRTGRVEPGAEQWRKLRFCESTETYAIDTGNTFYGAYQFTWETWGTVGGDGNPAHAPAAEQDARARLLYAQRGSNPWPICGRYLP